MPGTGATVKNERQYVAMSPAPCTGTTSSPGPHVGGRIEGRQPGALSLGDDQRCAIIE